MSAVKPSAHASTVSPRPHTARVARPVDRGCAVEVGHVTVGHRGAVHGRVAGVDHHCAIAITWSIGLR